MDFSVLLHPEVMIVVILLALIGAVLGFALGKHLQTRQGDEALAAANRNHARSVADLEADNSDTLWRLREGHADEIKKLQDQHARALAAAREEQASETVRINAEHAALVDRLNEANKANIRELRAERDTSDSTLRDQHAAEIRTIREDTERTLQMFREDQAQATEALRSEHQAHLQALKSDHAETVAAVQRGQDEMREKLTTEHSDKIQELHERISGLEETGEKMRMENTKLQDTIRELNNSIREAKRNNTFSLSKSGERLIRVIHSVQDLAQELDEASRAVSNGEYSFLDTIKDQRDRETVMKLTGGQPPTEEDHKAPEAPAVDLDADPANPADRGA